MARPLFFELPLIFIISIFGKQEYCAFANKDVYVSRHHGNDSRNCGSEEEPCRTLARGIEIADRNGLILLDGTLTKLSPYNCRPNKTWENSKLTRVLQDDDFIPLNFGIQIIALHAPAYISCKSFLKFIGLSSRSDQMNVNFSGIVFLNTSMTFLDLSVSFVNCIFLQTINPVKTALLLQQSAKVAVESSVFFNNTGCIRVKLAKSNTRVAIYLNNVNFTQNRPSSEHEGSGISIYKPLQARAENLNVSVSCKKTVFSYNIAPLITNKGTTSESNEFYQDVKFLKNYVYDRQNTTSGKSLYFSMVRSSMIVFDNLVSTGNINVRCVKFKSSTVKLKIINSHFSGHQTPGSGGSVLVNATNSIDVLIKGSSFNENKAGFNGGAVSINSVAGLTEITILKSNFTKNSAANNSGAFFINSLYGSVTVDVQYVLFKRTISPVYGALSVIANREIYFRARQSIWESSAADLGSAVLVRSFERQDSKTTTIVENCKFINNVDASFGNVLVLSSIGTIEVSQTEWVGNGQGFFMECDCVVNFTDVNLTRCNGTAFTGESTLINKAIMNLHFERCLFRANKGNDIDVYSENRYFQLSLKSTNFYDKRIIKGQGYNALKVVVDGNVALGSQILLSRVHVEDFVGAASVTLAFNDLNGANSVIVRNCTFRRIRSNYSESYHTKASPLSIVMPYDKLHHNVCSQSYLSYRYRNTIIIENTSFVENIGRMSGGVYLHDGNITIRNCTFEDNFAIQSGGHIHIEDGSAAVQIENSHFKQSAVEKTFANETYVHDTSIYSDSTGSLLLRKTLVTTDLEKSSYGLFSVTKAGMVKFDNHTRVQCAVGSTLRFDNFSHLIIWPLEPSKPPCKLKVTVMTLSCHQCSPSLYSLKRGEVLALHDRENSIFPPLTCISCPNGANCSRNIFAKPNYWGYPDSSDGSLKFTHCPPHYCTPTGQRIESLLEYNRCYGNRDGIMCGKCKDGYTETLFSKKCTQKEKCKDHQWIWILMFIYVVVMALFMIHQPPILQILVRSTLWFRKTYPNRMEYQPLNQRNNYDSGYTKILFYFYQIASYLTLESLADLARKTPCVSFFIGLFNFQTRISPKGLGCPFAGLTVVTKELSSALVVMAILLTIQIILMLHLSFNKLTKRPPATKVRYYGATLRTLLLGYATLANTSLKLLSCVPVLGESRLFYDGNIKCPTWWQAVLAIFIVSFLLPFVVVICWGGMKLRRKLISVEHFIGACFFPSVFIAYWLVQKFFRRWRHGPVASESRKVILQILHDPFRPPSPGQNGSLYWESVLIGRRFLIFSYQIFFPDPLLRLFCMDVTCLLIFVWHVATKPFRDWKANVIEAMSLAALVVIATINLVQAIFLSAGLTPQGPVKRNLNILQRIEISLLGIVPLLLALMCAFAIVSQVVRLIVLIYKLLVYAFRKIFRFVLLRRIRVMEQQYVTIN